MSYLLHHIFLPPKVPVESDYSTQDEKLLLNTSLASLEAFLSIGPHEQHGAIDAAVTMLRRMQDIHMCSADRFVVDELALVSALRQLDDHGGSIVLHASAQNAGLIFTAVKEEILVEVFEVSPTNQSVISTRGRLRRKFPASGVYLPRDILHNASFRKAIASAVAKMSQQRVKDTQPKAKKAAYMHDEDRDTTHPEVVTDFLISVLAPLGRKAETMSVVKNTRDEVFYYSSLQPWRRSPLWLVIRVTLQLVFTRFSPEDPDSPYKEFMIFAMARILSTTCHYEYHSDSLMAMSAKIRQRLLKIKRMRSPTRDFVRRILSDTDKILDTRWNRIQSLEVHKPPLTNLLHCNFTQDTLGRMPGLDDFIEGLLARRLDQSRVDFEPAFELEKGNTYAPPSLHNTSGDQLRFELVAFETWVACHLRSWLDTHRDDTSGQFRDLMERYHQLAEPEYSSDPESTSLMILTILELWIGCDEAALAASPLLQDYDPGIASELFQSLLLLSQCQMRRLLAAEEYLANRIAKSTHPSSDVLRAFGTRDSFSAKYYELSPEHQGLMKSIERRAAQCRQTKEDEFRNKKAQYDGLMRQYESNNCQMVSEWSHWDECFVEKHYPTRCPRCSYARKADAISIQIHEWPLPHNRLEASSTVFELLVPPSFGHWRDATTFLQVNVLGSAYCSHVQPRSEYTPATYKALSKYFQPFGTNQRITALSENKPHEATHRREKKVGSVTIQDVCLRNALHYRYYDQRARSFVNDIDWGQKVEEKCTYKLPTKSSSLQKFLRRGPCYPSGPSPNTVIASQSTCPADMPLGEFKALCSVPLGYRIQWQNILVQLRAPSINLNTAEATYTILQCAHQAGPRGSHGVLRESHGVFEDGRISLTLLDGLDETLKGIKDNWQAHHTLFTLISLACRIHSLTRDEHLRGRCLEFLKSAQETSIDWLEDLSEKLYMSTDDGERAELGDRMFTNALICSASLCLDSPSLRDIFFASNQVYAFLRCSTLIQETKQPARLTGSLNDLLYRRWQRLSYRIYQLVAEIILEKGDEPLNSVVQRQWPAFQASSEWRRVSPDHDNWLTTDATTFGAKERLVVHFNLLNGELLVNGVPLSRLPSEYESHSMYRVLFGHTAVEVMPTAIPGMRFSARNKVAGYTLNFGMSPGPELLIQAQGHDKQVYELVPRNCLRHCFPVALVEEYVHWYNVETKLVIFCEQKSPWDLSNPAWVLKGTEAEGLWALGAEDGSLIDVRSKTAGVIEEILMPLEDRFHMHGTFDSQSGSVRIELPRLRLGFRMSLDDGRIYSQQYRGMFIDEDQKIGSLVGLRSKIILRGSGTGIPRMILIPHGTLSYRKTSEHEFVHVDKGSATRTYAYRVDDQLGRLVSDGGLVARLWVCYLHALTSFCLPDTLTGRTGTEQALSILTSAAVKSFDALSTESMDILAMISRLTPRRRNYPAHKREMQVVKWDGALGFMAQYGGYHPAVQDLLDRHTRYRLFHPGSYVQPPDLKGVDGHLLARDDIRSSTFRRAEFGAEKFTTHHDVVYPARDEWKGSTSSQRAAAMSKIMYSGEVMPLFEMPLELEDHVWQYLRKHQSVENDSGALSPDELSYDGRWLFEDGSYIAHNFIKLHLLLSRKPDAVSKFKFTMWLSSLAYSAAADMPMLYALSTFRLLSIVHVMPPGASKFILSRGRKLKANELEHAVQQHCVPFHQSPEASIPRWSNEQKRKCDARRRGINLQNQQAPRHRLVSALSSQWPCGTLNRTMLEAREYEWSQYYNTNNAVTAAESLFKGWNDNRLLKQYIDELINHMPRAWQHWYMESPCITASQRKTHRARRFVTIDDLFTGPAPKTTSMDPPRMTHLLEHTECTMNTKGRLLHLISELESKATSAYEKRYVTALRASLRSLGEWNKTVKLASPIETIRHLLQQQQAYYQKCVDCLYAEILEAVGFSLDNVEGRLKQWPRLTPTFFLQQLSHRRLHRLSNEWKKSIVQYGLSISFVQQTTRRLGLCNDAAALIKDLSNTGHMTWDPYDHPETLLLEIDCGITIRDVQEKVAQRMITTPAGRNEVMQLNMGEGKSSVIVPMIATALGDGHRLLRVIVGKPQANQMLQMLVSKLGGLTDRPIYQLPFSRDVQPNESDMAEIQSIFHDCTVKGGVLLVQPEHILSFKLMALERMIIGKHEIGLSMLESLKFLDQRTRDIVDESDENFSVKFELIYTLGLQQPIDHSPGRWTCIHDILDILRKAVPVVHNELPESMEVFPQCFGTFPRTRILKEDAERMLLNLVATRICDVGLYGFPVSRLTSSIRPAVYKYLTVAELSEAEIRAVEESSFWSEQTSKTLLLLRGLLAERVLAFVFAQKRWRVDYGLVHTRKPPTRLAVPYRAKDQPNPQSEFSHPEVVILLTCLSYYYGGLTDDNLFEAFRHLHQSDQADMEYQAWVSDANGLPDSFQQLKGLNLEDVFQCTSVVFPCFRYAKAAVDYFLSHMVFTKDMKEFPHKLTASGWDLGELKSLPTTGFSGTNDSRVVLPLSVRQLDVPDQEHTNALVLSNLLRPENRVVMMESHGSSSGMSDAERLLSVAVSLQESVRVILDVGAQILELTNLGVAQTWLSMVRDDEHTKAVVFFDDHDRICVLNRHNTIEPLQTSPYAGQLDTCLVFLDEAHTRGTDLKLPQDYRAVVTLGANLTKDRLVQACMRMRELGRGQSVTFCVPHEIEMKIRSRNDHSSAINVAMILEWAISETWRDISRSIPVWAMQGKRYQEHERLWSRSRAMDGSVAISSGDARGFLEDEAQSIEARYQPLKESQHEVGQELNDATDDAIDLWCRDFGALDHRPATFREEQERELSPEIERERQIQKAPQAKPLPHLVHPDIQRFALGGILDKQSKAVMPALNALSGTSAAAHMDMSQHCWDLLVSRDYAQTIQIRGETAFGAQDCFQRPIQWILTGPHRPSPDFVEHMVIISPYEAQELLPTVMRSEFACLHLYGTRPNLGYRPLDSLDLYTVPERQVSPIPPSLILQLNMFAGQLYFDSFAEYTSVFRYFSMGLIVPRPLQNSHEGDGEEAQLPRLQEDCVKFFKKIYTKVRRDCEGIDKTHMGRLLNDGHLTVEDFTPVC